jgi:SnoaL-like protein
MIMQYPDYLGSLIAGNWEGLAELLGDSVSLDDPAGRLDGKNAVADFLRDKSAALRFSGASAERALLTATLHRAVDEQVLHFSQDGEEIHLPYAVVMDAQSDEKLRAIRIYYSNWPALHGHLVRKPILKEDPSLTLSGAPEQYQKALADGNVDDVLAVFEDDGYAREPAGNQYVYRGHEALREFYTNLFSIGVGGGIPLEHCTVTDDRVACAIEYNVTKLGSITVTPQAGVAVYERGPSGKLHAARIYDDVDIE